MKPTSEDLLIIRSRMDGYAQILLDEIHRGVDGKMFLDTDYEDKEDMYKGVSKVSFYGAILHILCRDMGVRELEALAYLVGTPVDKALAIAYGALLRKKER